MTSMYRIRTVLTGVAGLPGLSTCYFEEPVGFDATRATTCAGRVRGAWDVIKSSLAAGVQAQVQSGIDLIDPVDGALLGTGAITPPVVVTSTGANVGAPQVAGGLILNTGLVVSGRRLRGRLFISPLSQASEVGNTPPAGLSANLDAMGVALLTVSPPAANPLCIWHRPHKNPAGGVFPDGSESAALSAQHAIKYFTLRSRLN